MVWVLFLKAHTCLFVCLLFVFLCTRLFESMLMFMVECITTKETLGNSVINTIFLWLTKLGSFCNFSILTLLHILRHCTSMVSLGHKCPYERCERRTNDFLTISYRLLKAAVRNSSVRRPFVSSQPGRWSCPRFLRTLYENPSSHGGRTNALRTS